MNTEFKKRISIVSLALASVVASATVSFAGTCMTSGGASAELIEAARANPASLISGYDTKDAMTDAVRLLVATDTTLAALVIQAAAAAGATPAQIAGIGAGLARAAKICEPVNPAYSDEILAEVAKLDAQNPLVVAFQQGLNQFSVAATGGDGPIGGPVGAPGLGGAGGGGAGGGGGGGGAVAGTGSSQGGGSLRSSGSGGGRSTSTGTDAQSPTLVQG